MRVLPLRTASIFAVILFLSGCGKNPFQFSDGTIELSSRPIIIYDAIVPKEVADSLPRLAGKPTGELPSPEPSPFPDPIYSALYVEYLGAENGRAYFYLTSDSTATCSFTISKEGELTAQAFYEENGVVLFQSDPFTFQVKARTRYHRTLRLNRLAVGSRIDLDLVWDDTEVYDQDVEVDEPIVQIQSGSLLDGTAFIGQQNVLLASVQMSIHPSSAQDTVTVEWVKVRRYGLSIPSAVADIRGLFSYPMDGVAMTETEADAEGLITIFATLVPGKLAKVDIMGDIGTDPNLAYWIVGYEVVEIRFSRGALTGDGFPIKGPQFTIANPPSPPSM